MNILMQLFGGECDIVTDETYAPENMIFDAVITSGDGAVITEALDVNGNEITKTYITDGATLTNVYLPFPKGLSSITVTGSVMVYNIRSKYDK